MLAKLAMDAGYCNGIREWKQNALDSLRRHYGDLGCDKKTATAIFDQVLQDPQSRIAKRTETRPGFEQPFYFEFIVDHSEFGKMYFEFILLRDDPEDLVVQIVSVHPPSFPEIN